MSTEVQDVKRKQNINEKELELYRSLMEPAKEFKNGFTWTTVAGAIFCGLLMMPGTIFLSLVTGGVINASWVTLIIFSEISRRALKTLNTQELVVLLYVAGSMALGGPCADLIFRQYFIQSPAVRDQGLIGQFPSWWVPDASSLAIQNRDLLDSAWLIPIAIIFITMILGRVSGYTLGYFFFRLTSDVEKLPFPFAPINAQGAMALAESSERKTTDKWRIFSVGAIIGLVFGFVQIGIPLISQAITGTSIQLIPLPWYDTTPMTEGILPATPTGLSIDLGLLLTGMVIPFWVVMGQAAAVVLTLIVNPLLHNAQILTNWKPGMDTVATTMANSINFWMSFGFGVAAAIAVISIVQTVIQIRKATKENKDARKSNSSVRERSQSVWSNIPKGRGDFSPYIAIAIYVGASLLIVLLCKTLVKDLNIIFILILVLVYTPLISFINARLIGICGQNVEIPYIREAAYILSGYNGIAIWLAPIPVENHGLQAQSFRVNELTGTNFWSYVKADLLVIPLSFVLSLVFWAFIWQSSAIPSEAFPFAQKMWELNAYQRILMYSATMDTAGATLPLFWQAFSWKIIASGFGFTLATFTALYSFGVPVMAVYGFLQVVGTMPHAFIPQIIGAFIGRFYLQKRFGQVKFLQTIPIIVAGYGTGVGLITLVGVGILLIKNAISPALF